MLLQYVRGQTVVGLVDGRSVPYPSRNKHTDGDKISKKTAQIIFRYVYFTLVV